MGDILICVICKKSSGKIILFSEETLKKCQSILKLRKIHNLKYKDIILPSEYTDSGYHRGCYKSLTGLMKKYFTSKSQSSKKTIETDKEKETEKEASTPRDSSFPATSFLPELTIEPSHSEPSLTESLAASQPPVGPQSIKPQSSTSQEYVDISALEEVSENNDLISEVNSLIQIATRVDMCKNVYLFCNRKKKALTIENASTS